MFNSKDAVAETIASLLFPDLAVRPLQERLAIMNEIESNLGDDLSYNGYYSENLGQIYGQVGRDLPLEVLVALNEALGTFNFYPEHIKPRSLSLREALATLSDEALAEITATVSQGVTSNSILNAINSLQLDLEDSLTITYQAIATVVKQMVQDEINVTEEELTKYVNNLMLNDRGVLLESMVMYQNIGNNERYLAEVIEVIQEGTQDYQKSLAFQKASELEAQAKDVFRKVSIEKLRNQYPNIHQLVNLDMMLIEFLKSVTDYADTTYKLGMDWTEYSAKLAQRYETERFEELTRTMKREVLGVYTRTVGMKAQLAANVVGGRIAGASIYLGRRFVMATGLDKVYAMTKGAFDVTADACRTINEKIIQRGMRTLNVAKEFAVGDVKNESEKYGKWKNDETQGFIADAIIDELVGHEEFDKWAEQVENGQYAELQSAVAQQTAVVCADIDENGLEQLKERKILSNLEALQSELDLALVTFGDKYGYVFDRVNSLYEFGQVLRTNYESTLEDDLLFERENVLTDIIHNVGLRIAQRHVKSVELLDTDIAFIQSAISNSYAEARKRNIHYAVGEAEFFEKMGGQRTFHDLKTTAPISLKYEEMFEGDILAFIAQEMGQLPQKEGMTIANIEAHKQVLSKLLKTLSENAVQLTLRDGSKYKVTRSTHLWGSGSHDKAKIALELQDDERSILEQLQTNQADIRMLDLEKAQWLRVPYTLIESYTVVKSRISAPMFSQLYGDMLKRLLSEYTQEAKTTGFMLNQASIKYENLMAFALHVVQNDDVHLKNVESVMVELTKQMLAQSVTNVILTDNDKAIVHEVIGVYKTTEGIYGKDISYTPTEILAEITEQQLCECKELFDQTATKVAYQHLIDETVNKMQAPKESSTVNANNRLSIARQKAQEAVSKISHYTPQDKEVFAQFMTYAQRMQQAYTQAGRADVLNIQVSAENHLIQITFTDASEVFMLHPQFIINGISHKVYADRTGVMQFERAFTSEYDQSYGGDLGNLASLITARRKTDYAAKVLSEQDATRMSRLQEFLTTYKDEMKEANLQFAFLKAPNGAIQCGRIYSNGKEVYQFNPLYMLDIPNNKFVYERVNVGATLAELEAQFFKHKQTAHLNLQQMNILNQTFSIAYDLRRNLS